MDVLTQRQCVGADVAPEACSAAGGRGVGAANACTAAGGACEVLRDGFYILAGERVDCVCVWIVCTRVCVCRGVLLPPACCRLLPLPASPVLAREQAASLSLIHI